MKTLSVQQSDFYLGLQVLILMDFILNTSAETLIISYEHTIKTQDLHGGRGEPQRQSFPANEVAGNLVFGS